MFTTFPQLNIKCTTLAKKFRIKIFSIIFSKRKFKTKNMSSQLQLLISTFPKFPLLVNRNIYFWLVRFEQRDRWISCFPVLKENSETVDESLRFVQFGTRVGRGEILKDKRQNYSPFALKGDISTYNKRIGCKTNKGLILLEIQVIIANGNCSQRVKRVNGETVHAELRTIDYYYTHENERGRAYWMNILNELVVMERFLECSQNDFN